MISHGRSQPFDRVGSFWFGTEFSPYENLAMKSFIAHSVGFDVYTYDERPVPEGVTLRNAGEIIPRDQIFSNHGNPNSYSTFSDLFRYRLIEQTGIPWVDLDMVKLEAPFPRAELLAGFEEPGVVNGAVLFYEETSVLAGFIGERTHNFDPSQASQIAMGPKLISQAVKNLRLHDQVQHQDAFYPIHYLDIWKIFSPRHKSSVEKRLKHSSGLHLWNSILTRVEPDFKNLRPPAGSYAESLFEQHDVTPLRNKVCDFEALRRSLIPAPRERLWRFSRKLLPSRPGGRR